MRSWRTLYQMGRADFLERARRNSFLLTLGLAALIAYEASTGGIVLQVGGYRGVYNSAWVGGMMTLVSTTFLTLAGFYIVKNSVQRDERTRVGRVLATTPMSKLFYATAKALSNFVVLAAMLAVLVAGGIVLELLHLEEGQFALGRLLAPFIWVGLPAMAVVAALAVLFEMLPVLRTGVGNVIYFFVWIAILSTASSSPRFDDLVGFNLIGGDMMHALKASVPGYKGGFSLTISGPRAPTKTFVWNGVHWTSGIILHRLIWVGLAVALTLLAALAFHRFDPAREARRKAGDEPASARVDRDGGVPVLNPAAAMRLPGPAAIARGQGLARLVAAELILMLRGQRWWWLAAAAGMIAASLLVPSEPVRDGFTLAAWLWPVLLWAQMGARESRHDTGSLIFSCRRSLYRQLPALWIAGVVVAAAVGAGVGVHLLLRGSWSELPAWVAGILFVPALALALGVWSGTSKPFEVLYTVWWYVGPLHRVRGLDFTGMTPPTPNSTWLYLLATAALLGACYLGRRRKMAYA
ncbi:MAG: hypothetical protein ACREUL_14850 [Steroidobacteraceae bacterium]